MKRLENVVVANVLWNELTDVVTGTAEVSVDGDTETLVQISGPSREIVKALFDALNVGLGL